MDMIFNSCKFKYTEIDELIRKEGYINNSKKVSLYINLEPIFRKLIKINIEEYLRVKNQERAFELISNIINLASHYRRYFRKVGVECNIYFYITYPFQISFMKNKVFVPEYRNNYKHRFYRNSENYVFIETLNTIIPIVKIILSYVDGVYLITSNTIEVSTIPYIIMKNEKDIRNHIILTSEKYEYQYVNYDMNIFRYGKEKRILTKYNIMEYFVGTDQLSPTFLSTIISITGEPYRNITKIKGMGTKKIANLLLKGIELKKIAPTSNNIHLLLNLINDKYKNMVVLSNYYCTDVSYQYSLLTDGDKESIFIQLIDKYDKEALKQINEKYFQNSPIKLLELTDNIKW